MTEAKSPSHWDDLASTLGVQSPQEEASHQPTPPPVQPPPARKSAPHPRRQSQAVNWDALAGELGLAPALPPATAPEPSFKPIQESTPHGDSAAPAPISTIPPIASEPTAVVNQDRRDTPPPQTPEESPNFFDERFDFDEPFDLLESAESAGTTSEPPADSVESAEKRTKRRRRRRRGRGGRPDASEKTATAAEPGDVPIPEPQTDLSEQGEAHPAGDESHPGESDKPRSKRRRSRRGKKRREPEAPVASDDLATDADDLAGPKSHIDDSEPPFHDGDDLDLDEGGRDRPARLGFRGIPTWEEAVGMLIEKNIEARAKRPAAAAHHGRGNRGPRDGREGRGGRGRNNRS
jgi:hypothetical protein